MLSGEALLCGFYVNELLLKLLLREDSHPKLFVAYRDTLHALATTGELEASLRRLELKLLAELGYGLQLERDAATGEALVPDARYYYVFDRGPQRMPPGSSQAHAEEVSGATLLAMARAEYPDSSTAQESKRLMRQVLNHYLERQKLFSRQILRDMQSLEEALEGVSHD